ncbi:MULTISPECIES: tyrosine-type recombinase/integrase [unclassified Microbispora]|uniref:tyrosine-type recombinase/integrase n=1 Tax=unclassified Microbispora TaxID=2614687 RepID=UPI0011591033|nr:MULTISPECIES: tyrosine-type recombinase/integrase [unclassified Microbispora]TQS21390.1 tyrosine-type recombinase/integrase [Microbispora sp. KK1-11]
MNTSYDVKFWEIRRNQSSKKPSFVARWTVGGREKSKTFRTKELANSHLRDLRLAAKNGEAFDIASGLPVSMLEPQADAGPTVLAFAQKFITQRWKTSAARTRETDVYALLALVPALVKDLPGRPDADEMRKVLREYVLLPEERRGDLPPKQAPVLRWLETASLPLTDLKDARVVRMGLDAISVTFKGKKASANTVLRKREVFHHLLELAMEEDPKPFDKNPLDSVKWTAPDRTDEVDPRTVVNPGQARALLAAASRAGRTRGARMRAMYACMYYAALRPEEAAGLKRTNCHLPEEEWGMLTLEKARPFANKRYTDSGEAHDDRGLKHRAEKDTRPVPIPPALVKILREHIEKFGVTKDGRLFATSKGGLYTNSAISRVWKEVRKLAFTPEQVASPLAATPYGLRHAAVSLWLASGVPATEVAQRAGHSVEVLQRVYAKVIDGQAQAANKKIMAALDE